MRVCVSVCVFVLVCLWVFLCVCLCACLLLRHARTCTMPTNTVSVPCGSYIGNK